METLLLNTEAGQGLVGRAAHSVSLRSSCCVTHRDGWVLLMGCWKRRVGTYSELRCVTPSGFFFCLWAFLARRLEKPSNSLHPGKLKASLPIHPPPLPPPSLHTIFHSHPAAASTSATDFIKTKVRESETPCSVFCLSAGTHGALHFHFLTTLN